MANYEASSRQLPEWTEENREETARAGLKADTWTRDFPNTNEGR